MNEMNNAELDSVNGGVVPWIVTALGGAAIGAVISGWPDFKEGFQDAFWHQQNLAN